MVSLVKLVLLALRENQVKVVTMVYRDPEDILGLLDHQALRNAWRKGQEKLMKISYRCGKKKSVQRLSTAVLPKA